jgi:ABC-type ATPase involved in cell division
MIIESISIRNFKRVSDINVDLKDITYIVGGNNSGKSSVLQAIHMAASCAQRSAELQQQVIAESSLRYCPTGDFQRLGNSGPYENRKDGSRGIIDFHGKTSDGADASYKVEIYKARNFHNVGVDRSGVYPGFGQLISDPSSLFSVYVPGLAGIPHHEEMQSYASVFIKAAGGEANLVFRNIIRLISERSQLSELENLLYDVIGPSKFRIKFDQDKDLYVEVKISLSDNASEDSYVPIDLCGTGVMQITQILAYVILFKPKLLLVDEPDSHLHPSRQALLSAAFTKIVEQYGCRVLVSTHSRHLVSSAPADAKLVWLRNGQVESQDDNGLAAMLLDLGALDQIDSAGADVLFCTEDKGKKPLENCLDHANLKDRVKVISYNGVTNAASAAVIHSMASLFARKPHIIIHRDRDFLTEEEITKWGTEFTNRGMTVWCPTLPDIESYYVTPEHVATVYGLLPQAASTDLDNLINSQGEKLRVKFREKRRQAIQQFWKDGGGPATDQLWPPETAPSPETTLGKEIIPRVNEHFGGLHPPRRNLYSVPNERLSAEISKAVAEATKIDAA